MSSTARLEIADYRTGQWIVARPLPMESQIDELAADYIIRQLGRMGIEACLSCECGSYEYGGCGECNPINDND